MKFKELAAKNTEELKKALDEVKRSLLDIKVENQQGKLKNPHQIGAKRKEIAHIRTLIRIQELKNDR